MQNKRKYANKNIATRRTNIMRYVNAFTLERCIAEVMILVLRDVMVRCPCTCPSPRVRTTIRLFMSITFILFLFPILIFVIILILEQNSNYYRARNISEVFTYLQHREIDFDESPRRFILVPVLLRPLGGVALHRRQDCNTEQ